MNKFFRMVLAGLPALCAAGAPAEPASTNAQADCLSFRNGDVFYGKLLDVQPGSVIRWQHPDAAEPIDFKPESVTQIDFAPRPAAAGHTNDSCRLWLANGDELAGNLVSCDREGLTLETWYAGKLKAPRRSLQTLAFNPHTPVVLDGLTSLEGWTEGTSSRAFGGQPGQWSYRNGAFYADKPASIARDVKLPDRARLEFDLAWKGPLNLAIALYTDSLEPIRPAEKEQEPNFGGFYSLRFDRTVFVTLTAIKKKEPLRPLGDPLIVQSLTQKDRVHVDLCLSKAERRVALFMDGMLIKDWTDADGFTGEGTGLRFVNNPGGAVKLSHLRVAKWDGVLEDASAEEPDPSHDVVLLESGGKVSGAVVSIAGGQISLLTTGGARTVPLGDARAIEFARFQGQAPPAAAVNTHGTFVEGGSVTFELLGWRADGVAGISPDFGKMTFDPAVFGRLQFLAEEPKPAGEPKN